MSDPYISQIDIYGFSFAPKGFAACSGQLIDIRLHSALFSLIGTTYGGDGRVTFGLPNMSGRTPISEGLEKYQGRYFSLGEFGGMEQVMINPSGLAKHRHKLYAMNADGNQVGPEKDRALAIPEKIPLYGPGDTDLVPLAGASIEETGMHEPHPNIQPSIAVNFAISLSGYYPPKN